MKYKNLKVYSIPKKKCNLIRIMSGALVPLLLIPTLTSCTSNKVKYDDYGYSDYYDFDEGSYDYNNYTEYEVPSTTTTHSSNYDNSNSSNNNQEYNISLDLDESMMKIINSNVVITDYEKNNFINYINTIKVNYPYSELYDVNIALNNYKSLNKYISQSSNLFVNNKLSAEKLYSIVTQNNSNANFYEKDLISSTKLLQICKIIAETINSHINELDNNEIKILSEKISDLKIKKFTEFANGYYDPNIGVLGLSLDSISKSDDLFKKTIQHETFHLMQSSSKQEVENSNVGIRFGPTIEFNDIKMNTLYWNWYFEGAAEYLMLNYNDTKETSLYANNVKAIDAIKVATILNKNNDIDGLEKASLKQDISSIYKYFGCQTEEQKKEIVRLMFGFDIALKTNHNDSIDEFYRLYENSYGSKMSITDKLDFERQLKGSIAATLTKIFYTNLGNQLTNKNVSIEEIFSFISVFENEMNRLAWYATYREKLPEFFDTYTNIQSNFFEIISKKLGISVDEVQQAYNAFNKNYTVKSDSFTIVDNNKKEYYQYIIDTRKNDKTKSINYVDSLYEAKQKGR